MDLMKYRCIGPKVFYHCFSSCVGLFHDFVLSLPYPLRQGQGGLEIPAEKHKAKHEVDCHLLVLGEVTRYTAQVARSEDFLLPLRLSR